MTRRAGCFFSFLLIAAACVPIWRDFRSEESGFAIEFPGTPEEDEEIQQAPFGEVELRHFAFIAGRWSPSWIALYLVSRGKIIRPSDGPPDADEFIKWQSERVLQSIQSLGDTVGDPNLAPEVADDLSISLNGHPGRALKILEPNGVATNVRIYYVNGAIYTLMVSDEDDDRAERFLESFELL